MYRTFKAYPAILDLLAFDNTERLMLSPHLLGVDWSVETMTVHEYIRSIPISRRRKALVRALRRVEEHGYSPERFSQFGPFQKWEKLPYFTQTQDCLVSGCEVIPRLILAPNEETHLIAGIYLKPLTRALKKVWNKDHVIFYGAAKPEVLDEWLSTIVECESFFWADYSAYDSTWSDRAWDMIERFYRYVYPNAPDLFWEVLSAWRHPRGKAKSRREEAQLHFQAEACNASGRDDTALANALLNGLALFMSFTAALHGVAVGDVTEGMVRGMHDCVRISVVGDDSLVGCNFNVAPLVDDIQRNLESFGLVVKAKCSPNLYDVTYLGCMPYRNRHGVTWGPTIGRRLYKAFWQAEGAAPQSHLPAWVRGVAQQMALYANVPILCELSEKVIAVMGAGPVTLQKDENRPWAAREVSTTRWDEVTIAWLGLRYPGITPKLIAGDLDTISKIARLPVVAHLECVQLALLSDDL